jgi:hypothetical protein
MGACFKWELALIGNLFEWELTLNMNCLRMWVDSNGDLFQMEANIKSEFILLELTFQLRTQRLGYENFAINLCYP